MPLASFSLYGKYVLKVKHSTLIRVRTNHRTTRRGGCFPDMPDMNFTICLWGGALASGLLAYFHWRFMGRYVSSNGPGYDTCKKFYWRDCDANKSSSPRDRRQHVHTLRNYVVFRRRRANNKKESAPYIPTAYICMYLVGTTAIIFLLHRQLYVYLL